MGDCDVDRFPHRCSITFHPIVKICSYRITLRRFPLFDTHSNFFGGEQNNVSIVLASEGQRE